MKRYIKYIKPYLPAFIIGPIMMLTEVFGEIWIPRLMAMIIDNGIASRNMTAIFQYGALMIAACGLMVIGGVLGCYFSAKASISFSGDLRSDLFRKVQDFSFSNLDEFSTGSLVTRLTNDVQQIQNMITMMLRMALRAPGMMIGALIMAVMMNAQLALILLVVIPLLSAAIFLLLRAAYPRFNKMQRALDRLNNGIQEALTNVRVVKSFVREDYEEEKFQRRNENLRKKTLAAMNIVICTMPVMQLAMNITSCAVVWFGGNQVIAGSMQVGDLTAFITYITQILMSLMMVAMIILQSSRSMASFKRISEVLDTEIDVSDEAASMRERKVTGGSIEFRDVCFAYPQTEENEEDLTEEEKLLRSEERRRGSEESEEYVLEHISFRIESGETVGILGATGCGKTSMVQLIPRLYDASCGEVLVDGVNVREYSLSNLRDAVSMVLQYNTLFSGTISENLRWGNENASDEELYEAAEAAQADGFIRQFADGYETMIEQGGTNVSGGQKQRICIARALLKKPRILILDDSTSAVDTATEARIRAAFSGGLRDTTKLIISQRISSVRDADRIIVMEDGRISDIGTHAELMARCEEYREIYYSQNEKEEEVSA